MSIKIQLNNAVCQQMSQILLKTFCNSLSLRQVPTYFTPKPIYIPAPVYLKVVTNSIYTLYKAS